MDLSSVRVLHLHYSTPIPGSILHDWKPNIEILAITAVHHLESFCNTTLVTSVRVLIRECHGFTNPYGLRSRHGYQTAWHGNNNANDSDMSVSSSDTQTTATTTTMSQTRWNMGGIDTNRGQAYKHHDDGTCQWTPPYRSTPTRSHAVAHHQPHNTIPSKHWRMPCAPVTNNDESNTMEYGGDRHNQRVGLQGQRQHSHMQLLTTTQHDAVKTLAHALCPSYHFLTFRSSQGCTAVSIDTCTAFVRFIGHFWRDTCTWVGNPRVFVNPRPVPTKTHTCGCRGNFSEVSKNLVRWRSAGGWKLEELFLVMRPDDGKHLDWQNLQTMLNKTRFPLLHSVNIVQVGGQKPTTFKLVVISGFYAALRSIQQKYIIHAFLAYITSITQSDILICHGQHSKV
ncbi:uncharacterized protein LACBIDRAFT_335625 [Laccaria bicolor S238N-H82]|uniref:Predicted protein n=1 Tax=Laccaria bicolor (strain S238N-H82 / ATCC MYA-4686) TaxID=486041 RepID=B0E2V9_LACBS|nr:uncharacterized protein LACBIDRAFT_335625 [Laccaria bicolor S238N-H82]EDQ98817.1 predicted protein [Laccaria bicolor S238N-H82]|eukprot:XP_001890527.1 predicted protein [Laccaria bicolor S238N-H82]